ncbi:hypothetical protein KRR39_12640 [Nocardioides panacis]|uniref:C4-type zinc ribbon domain-containing protein n=1 Tax=Nocardioides panacis TaxID=2849501 RepID=A0A975T2S7_9ACTN|nr:hypothetical protein KRR39_12640 [Nocardioides panacis]
MKADAFSQLKLLDVQELDARIDLLGHRLRSLPETQEIATLAAERAELVDHGRDATIKVEDLTREQRKADSDVEQVKTRRKRDQERMDQGLITNPKDLAHMQQELVSLTRRISELEDTELDVMEQLEAAQAEQSRIADRLAEIDARSAALVTSRDAAAAEITREAESVTAERKVTATGVPADLLALYEKVRAQKGGVGAAVLRARQCTGCSLQLNAHDLGVIAKAPLDEVIRCEECNRILVRTAESGI